MSNLEVVEGGASRASLKRGSEEWATATRRQARKLARELDTGYMKLARILWEVFDTPVEGDPNKQGIYTAWGHKTFPEYAHNELGIGARKAHYLKRCWYKLKIENGDLLADPSLEARVMRLGWTKVRELAEVITPTTAEAWVTRAEQMSVSALLVAIAQHKADIDEAARRAQDLSEDPDAAAATARATPPPEDPEVVVTRTFTFFDGAHENVEQALEEARRIVQQPGSPSFKKGKNNEGILLDLICTEFLATNTFERADRATKVALFHRMANLVGLDVVLIDPQAPREQKIIYGMGALEALAEQGEEGEEEET